MKIESRSPQETQTLGQRLGELAQPGDLLLLRGTLGAGKTTLTQGFAWGAGARGYAHSPTFILVNNYPGRIPIHHVDLYRINADLEAHDLAFDEMLDHGAVLVEWPERASPILPSERLSITLSFSDSPNARTIELTPNGERYETLIRALQPLVSP